MNQLTDPAINLRRLRRQVRGPFAALLALLFAVGLLLSLGHCHHHEHDHGDGEESDSTCVVCVHKTQTKAEWTVNTPSLEIPDTLALKLFNVNDTSRPRPRRTNISERGPPFFLAI